MIIVAAIAVTIASLTAVASMAGWLPSSNATATGAAPATQVAVAPASEPAAPPVPDPVTAKPAAPAATSPAPKKIASAPPPAPRKVTKQVDYTYDSTTNGTYRGATPVGNYPMNDSGVYVESNPQPAARQAPQYSNTCRDCATVENVREVKQEGEGTGLGAVSGGVVGGLLGNQVGGGRGKTVGAVVGAVGGAFAGNAIEKNVRSSTHYEITVRLDDGNTRVFTQSQPPALQRGDRVRINNGQLIRM